jgi:hypothetical protein
MIDEEKLDRYLWDLKSEPLFGRPIAETLLKRDSTLRKEILIMLDMAQEGKFKKSEEMMKDES